MSMIYAAARLAALFAASANTWATPQAVEPPEPNAALEPTLIGEPRRLPLATTLALGEEDGGTPYAPPVQQPYNPYTPGTVTTLALGEEDGGAPHPTIPTTLAIGEEDGGGPIPVEPDGGIGDGAGPIPRPVQPYPTTLALGEEDGGTPYAPPVQQPYNPYTPGTVTTLALGEEDGGAQPPTYPDGPTITTLAIGEEG